MDKSAIISDCGSYRYRLGRKWADGVPCVFVMLNPSTADAEQDDPTIRRCIAFAKAWGCGELIVVNLFAFRATSPRDMMEADDPVGPDNMEHVRHAAAVAKGRQGEIVGPVVCAWGSHGSYMGQDETVLGWLQDELVTPMALKVTKQGHPGHPLYLKSDLEPEPLAHLKLKLRGARVW